MRWVLLAIACCHAAWSEAPQPKEQVIEQDAGVVAREAKVEREFEVTNDEGCNVVLRTKGASCGCTTLKLASETLKPGEKSRVRVGIDTRGKGVGRHTVWARVEVANAAAPAVPARIVKYVISYSVAGLYGLGRDLVLVGDVRSGESKVVEEKLGLPEAGGREASQVSASVSWVRAELTGSQGDRRVRMTISPPADAVLGPFQEYVFVSAGSDPDQGAKLAVNGAIRGRSALSSYRVVLFAGSADRAPSVVNIACESGQHIGEVRVVRAPDHVVCESVRVPRSDSASVRLRVKEGASFAAARRDDVVVEIAYGDGRVERARIAVTVPARGGGRQAPPDAKGAAEQK